MLAYASQQSVGGPIFGSASLAHVEEAEHDMGPLDEKKISKPSIGYAFRKPSGLINSLEWRSYYVKLLENKGCGCKGHASASRADVDGKMHAIGAKKMQPVPKNQPLCIGFSKKNRPYDQMLFNNGVIDILAPYPFGVVHLKQNYQRRLPSNRCTIHDARGTYTFAHVDAPKVQLQMQVHRTSASVRLFAKVQKCKGASGTDNIVDVKRSETTNWLKTPLRYAKIAKKQEANNNQFIEQGEVTSPFFQNFEGVHKKTFFTNSKIMMRPFLMDEQVNKVGMGSFVRRTQIPILDCTSNQRSFLSNKGGGPLHESEMQKSGKDLNSWCTEGAKQRFNECIFFAHAQCTEGAKVQVHTKTYSCTCTEGASAITSEADPKIANNSTHAVRSIALNSQSELELQSYIKRDQQGRQGINVHSLPDENLAQRSIILTPRYLPAPTLESLYNKFHTLPIFSTFIYKEWSHRFSFLEYFIWSARKNDLGLPFYNRRGACHTTRVNSINLIRNQIGAEGSKQFLFGFNGCTKNISYLERSQKGQLEHRFLSNSHVKRDGTDVESSIRKMLQAKRIRSTILSAFSPKVWADPQPFEGALCTVGMQGVSATVEGEKETFPSVASSDSIFDGDLRSASRSPKMQSKRTHVPCTRYLVSKNALQVIELRDKSSFSLPALSVQPVCFKKAFFSSQFSFYNLDGCLESGTSKTSQQHSRDRLFVEMEDTNEKMDQFASNNCNAPTEYQVQSETDTCTKGDLRHGCKVHQKDTELIKKKVSALSIFRHIDKFFGWRSYANVDSYALLINSPISPNSSDIKSAPHHFISSLQCTSDAPQVQRRGAKKIDSNSQIRSAFIKPDQLELEQSKRKSTEVSLHSRVYDPRIADGSIIEKHDEESFVKRDVTEPMLSASLDLPC